jgi:uncharacterized protein (TIGR03435 family)
MQWSIPAGTWAALLAAGSIVALSVAQSPGFEVVSIKPAAHPEMSNWRLKGGPGTPSPGLFTAMGAPVLALIGYSYDLKPYQIIGPSSMSNTAYDIAAKVPGGATRKQFLVMIQRMLAERFELRFHWETRNIAAYELVVAKGGSKLRPAENVPPDSPPPALKAPFPKDKDGFPILPPGVVTLLGFADNGNIRYVARKQPVDGNFLVNLEGLVGRPVVDRTGLKGVYDFNLFFAPEPINAYGGSPSATPPTPIGEAASEPAPNIFAAIEQQLGLRLRSAKAPTRVFAVDGFNRAPAED